MEEIYIVDDQINTFTTKVIKALKIKSIDYYDLINDEELDKFVIKIFQQNKIDKIIIPVSLGQLSDNIIGIQIGLHIRFSKNIGAGNLVPILFISDKSLETVLIEDKDKLSLITITEGSDLVSSKIEDIAIVLKALNPIAATNFYGSVLSKLIIPRPESVGPHSIANEWSAIKLDSIANLKSLRHLPILKKKHTLYFKYINILNNFEIAPLNNLIDSNNTITAYNKRILFIDDKGHKGWEHVLSAIFKGATFKAISQNGLTEEEFFQKIDLEITSDWDLILVDLRLLPNKEDIKGKVLPINEYSGTKILIKIKELNQGNQVIIFTASNKAWNMKSLLEIGADGYYIKESPEYNISDQMSLENYRVFQKQVEKCFERKHLREIYTLHIAAINERINNTDFLTLSEIGLNRSFQLLNQNMKEAAFLNYFQIIEYYASVNFDSANKSISDLSGTIVSIKNGRNYILKYYDDVVPHLKIENSNTAKTNGALFKISCLMAFKFSKDNAYLLKIGSLVKKRNDIAHTGTATIDISDYIELINIIKIFRSNI